MHLCSEDSQSSGNYNFIPFSCEPALRSVKWQEERSFTQSDAHMGSDINDMASVISGNCSVTTDIDILRQCVISGISGCTDSTIGVSNPNDSTGDMIVTMESEPDVTMVSTSDSLIDCTLDVSGPNHDEAMDASCSCVDIYESPLRSFQRPLSSSRIRTEQEGEGHSIIDLTSSPPIKSRTSSFSQYHSTTGSTLHSHKGSVSSINEIVIDSSPRVADLAPPSIKLRRTKRKQCGERSATLQKLTHGSSKGRGRSSTKETCQQVERIKPLLALTVDLIRTYKGINTKYYERKKRRIVTEESQRQLVYPGSQREVGSQGCNNIYVDAVQHDDDHFDYIWHASEVLKHRYTLYSMIGKGSFGQVLKAYDSQQSQYVAIKIIKNTKAFHKQAQTEIHILKLLNRNDSQDTRNVVRMYDQFMYRNHQCLVFELLSYSLYDLIKDNNFCGVSLNLIRKFAMQLLNSLSYLSGHLSNTSSDFSGVIHCDLKPENILLKHPRRSAVKVIDFGSSCFISQRMYTYIQSRFYRAPEVLLGLQYGFPIDMWSLGCILVELHTGEPLFNGPDECTQIAKHYHVLGPPPEHMILNSRKGKECFHRVHSKWRLRRQQSSNLTRRSLRTILGVETHGPGGRRKNEKYGHTLLDYLRFEDLISRMLEYDPRLRILPQEALAHAFFLPSEHTNEFLPRTCSEEFFSRPIPAITDPNDVRLITLPTYASKHGMDPY